MSAGGGSRDGGFRQWLVLAWGPCGAHPCPKTHLALCFLPLVCFLVFLSSSAPETHSVTDNWTGPSSSTSGMFPRSSLFFLFKIHSLLKYILGNTFWEIHFEKHIVRVHCAEIQHCYLREAKTFEQITLGKKHLARNVWRLRMCFTICLAWCESNHIYDWD